VTVWFKLKGVGYTDAPIPLGVLLPNDADRQGAALARSISMTSVLSC
jgi:hypothetical protein